MTDIINELSKDTLHSYMVKARKAGGRKAGIAKAWRKSETKTMEEVTPKTLSQIIEAGEKLHPNALHVKPVKTDSGTKYQVHAVGKNLAHGIKKGEHLSDTELDDATEIGAKIKHIKEGEEGSWFGKSAKKKKSDSVSITTPEHEGLQQRTERNKGEGTDESIDYVATFAQLLNKHGYQQKLVEWRDAVVSEGEVSQSAAIKTVKKNIETRSVSSDNDTDVVRDFDKDEPRKHHHKKLKNFRTYYESTEVDESISARQALSKAADLEYKAANSDSPKEEATFKGKAKALRRAARLAQQLASTVNIDPSKMKSR